MTVVPLDAKSPAAVTHYLSEARRWLDTAVETSTPHGIFMAKAEIATAVEATKQLRLSEDIQLDAQEMVRRAEFVLSKSISQGQVDGTVQTVADGHRVRDRGPDETKTSVRALLPSGRDREHHAVVAPLKPRDFDAAIDAAKAEGNLSRANVARKAREQQTATATAEPKTHRRRPLRDQFFDAVFDARKAIERLGRLADDDRLPQNAEQIATKHGSDLSRCKDLLEQVIANINHQERTS